MDQQDHYEIAESYLEQIGEILEDEGTTRAEVISAYAAAAQAHATLALSATVRLMPVEIAKTTVREFARATTVVDL